MQILRNYGILEESPYTGQKVEACKWVAEQYCKNEKLHRMVSRGYNLPDEKDELARQLEQAAQIVWTGTINIEHANHRAFISSMKNDIPSVVNHRVIASTSAEIGSSLSEEMAASLLSQGSASLSEDKLREIMSQVRENPRLVISGIGAMVRMAAADPNLRYYAVCALAINDHAKSPAIRRETYMAYGEIVTEKAPHETYDDFRETLEKAAMEDPEISVRDAAKETLRKFKERGVI